MLDTPAEQAFDDIARLAAFVCKTPISLISLIDKDRQWFKARVGLEAQQTPRDQAFCAHAILNPSEVMVVPDATKDPRFVNNPLVTGDPSIRFYAGIPLVTPTGEALGTLCVIDRTPRTLDADQQDVLRALGRQVMAQFDLRRSLETLEQTVEEQQRYVIQLESYQRDMEKVQAKLTTESSTDGLTGLGNRRALEIRLGEEFDRARRSNAPLALAMLDVDKFKPYNDSFGHPAGDEVLRQLAKHLQQAARPYDFPARYGGEEFVVLLPATSRDAGLVVAERIRRSVQRAVWPHRPVTVSLGLATTESGVSTPEELLQRADEALYRSKESGRNRVTLAGS